MSHKCSVENKCVGFLGGPTGPPGPPWAPGLPGSGWAQHPGWPGFGSGHHRFQHPAPRFESGPTPVSASGHRIRIWPTPVSASAPRISRRARPVFQDTRRTYKNIEKQRRSTLNHTSKILHSEKRQPLQHLPLLTPPSSYSFPKPLTLSPPIPDRPPLPRQRLPWQYLSFRNSSKFPLDALGMSGARYSQYTIRYPH